MIGHEGLETELEDGDFSILILKMISIPPVLIK